MDNRKRIVLELGLLVGGFVLGKVTNRKIKNKGSTTINNCGNIRVDNSEPEEGSRIFLELSEDGYNKILNSKKIELDVIIESYVTSK